MSTYNDPPHSREDALPEGVVVVLLAERDVALLLNCSRQHIRRLTRSNRMPAPVRLGALVRWRRAEIQRWIDNGCQRVDNGRTTG